MWAVLAGAAMMGAQVCLAEGYRYADASEVGVYQYTTLIYVGIIDWVIWHVVPSPLDLVGVLLVLVAGMIIIRDKGPKKHKRKLHQSHCCCSLPLRGSQKSPWSLCPFLCFQANFRYNGALKCGERMSVTKATVGIVGAGPLGLELAIALKSAKIDYIQFDKGR